MNPNSSKVKMYEVKKVRCYAAYIMIDADIVRKCLGVQNLSSIYVALRIAVS